MRSLLQRSLSIASSLGLAGTFFLSGPAHAAEPRVLTGNIDGADYKIEVPDNWNGTLLLYSHGTVLPGRPNPAVDQPDPVSGAWLLQAGYALAGSSFSSTGYVVASAMHDNIALLDYFNSAVGRPKRTIAWGTSQGGAITAALLQKYPDRFSGALPISGVLGGAVASKNLQLDSAFVLQTLLPGGSDLAIANIDDPNAALAQAQQIIAQAQDTAEGRARLAFAAAVADLPGWYSPTSPPPAADDYSAQEANQFSWFKAPNLVFMIAFRAHQERLAGGNFSWNHMVDYRQQLDRSINRDEVYALYAAAGLDLDADLLSLAHSPRVHAEPIAVKYLTDNDVFDGRLQSPVLAMHTTGDGLVPVQMEAAYAEAVRAAGKSGLLRQVFVNRAGHGTFTPAEIISGLLTLAHRLDVGYWENEDAAALNARATDLGPELNILKTGFPAPPQPTPMQPAFVEFQPAPFLRPFDARCISGTLVAPLTGGLGPVCL